MKWDKVRLGDVVTFRGGGTPRKDVQEFWSNDIPWATVKDFKGLSLSCAQDSISRKGLESSSANLIPAGHVIIPTRMALGKAAINTIDIAINQDLRALIPKKPLEAKYLLHSMLGLADIIVQNGSGATVKGITQEKLSKFKIPLPPLPEQKRIAKILDAADALRAKRRESLAQLDALIQSTFLDMFGDPVTNPMGWSQAELCSLIEEGDRINYGVVQPGEEWPEGKPLVRVGDFVTGELEFSEIKLIDPDIEKKYQRSRLNGRELLVSCVGSIGTICKVPKKAAGFNIARAVARVPLREEISRDFMLYCLRSDAVQRHFLKETRTVSQPTLNIALIKSATVIQPPLDLQHGFASIIESIERQKTRLRNYLAELDTLFASLQHRAFNGGL
jgi:type I restriction enzyme, S subunit